MVSVNINYLLKQPIFRTPEDLLRNYTRPVNIRFESGMSFESIVEIIFMGHCVRLHFRSNCSANSSFISYRSMINHG